MSGSSVFSETLQEITNTKLDELSKRRTAFEAVKSSTLSSIQSLSDPIERAALLSEGLKKCFAIQTDPEGRVITGRTKHRRVEVQVRNIDRFLAQARHDPSVSERAAGDWERVLLGFLDTQSLRFQYASLYGELVTEWLSEPGDKKKDEGGGGDAAAAGAAGDDDEAFEDVGSAAKLESRSRWESSVFEPASVDVGTLVDYLNDLFGHGPDSAGDQAEKKKRDALQNLQSFVVGFEGQLSRPDQFDKDTVKIAMQGLLSSDLLTNEKREVLNDFMGSPVILSEISDVLNMRYSALDSWSWGSGGVPVEQRRKINGAFSIHMHEDLLQAVFVQYIGVKWSVFFKRAFTTIRKIQGAWSSLDRDIHEMDRRRLEYYMGPLKGQPSLQKIRQTTYDRDYFVAKLLRRDDQVSNFVDGEVEAEYSNPTKRKMGAGALRHRRCKRAILPTLANRSDGVDDSLRRARFRSDAEAEVDEDEDEDELELELEPVPESSTKNPLQLKQQLLHLLSTEIAINTRLHGELSAFHAVFKDWDSLLPHETVLTVLEYFGVSSRWLGFFTKYLQAPLRFADGGDESPKVLRRGVPSSHVLSDVFGETVLFCLDMAVNQAADGQPLWRFEDDLWFWSADKQITTKAWKTIEQFASVTATRINEDKSGSVRVTRDNDTDMSHPEDVLPQGEIRWGFLVLSPQTGRFEIDQVMVDAHIAELGQQLKAKRHSVLGLIQTWNTYANKFFSSNFGTPATCFGRKHVDDMLKTHKRIQQQIFSPDSAAGLGPASSIVDYLKKTIARRFGVADVPDGYIYFPADLGGLELWSPFIPLLQIRDVVPESHDALFDAVSEAERAAYELARERFESGRTVRDRRMNFYPDWTPDSTRDRECFFGWDEFVSHRENLCILGWAGGAAGPKEDIAQLHRTLMMAPRGQSVDLDTSSMLSSALSQLTPEHAHIKPVGRMDSYWLWVTVMYGPEIIERFGGLSGGLSMVDAGILPMGMVKLFRDKRVTWKD